MYLSILIFNYFIIFHYYRSIYTLLCFKYFTYFHYGQKKIIMPSVAETRHAAEPRPYSAAKPCYSCCSTGISTSLKFERSIQHNRTAIRTPHFQLRETEFPRKFAICTSIFKLTQLVTYNRKILISISISISRTNQFSTRTFFRRIK